MCFEDELIIYEFLCYVMLYDFCFCFFVLMKEFIYEFIVCLMQFDYVCVMVFIVFEEVIGEMVGVVWFYFDLIYESGEYVILLCLDLKGRGFGWVLMQFMIDYVRLEGLKVILGDVFQENIVMFEMC